MNFFNNKPLLWITISSLTSFAFLSESAVHAAIVPPTLNWDAAIDPNDQFWVSPVNDTSARRWNFGSAATAADITDPVIQTLSKAYGDTATMASFESLGFGGTNPTQQDATFELVLRADSSDLAPNARRTLLETGGDGDGMAFMLDAGNLIFRVQQYNPAGGNGGVPNDDADVLGQISIPFPTDGLFHQIVGTIDVGNDQVSIYVDGVLQTTVSSTIQNPGPNFGNIGDLIDWAGANGSGLSITNSSIAGATELGGGFTDFTGDVAILRYYRDQVLTGPQVLGNYNAIAIPEPSSIALASLGLLGLIATHVGDVD